MLSEVQGQGQRVYLAYAPIDMRKSIDGLAIIVQQSFSLDPFSASLFVFSNRQRNKLKILEWKYCGFWLHYLRLEKGKFQWPSQSDTDTICIEPRQLRWLLDGLSVAQKQAHREVPARTII